MCWIKQSVRFRFSFLLFFGGDVDFGRSGILTRNLSAESERERVLTDCGGWSRVGGFLLVTPSGLKETQETAVGPLFHFFFQSTIA
jgi:hypothetical protein